MSDDGRRIPIHGDVVEDKPHIDFVFNGVGHVVSRRTDGARLMPNGGGWSTDGHNDAWFSSLSKAAGALQAWALEEEAKADVDAG